MKKHFHPLDYPDSIIFLTVLYKFIYINIHIYLYIFIYMKKGKHGSLKRIKSYFEKLEQAFPKSGYPKI